MYFFYFSWPKTVLQTMDNLIFVPQKSQKEKKNLESDEIFGLLLMTYLLFSRLKHYFQWVESVPG